MEALKIEAKLDTPKIYLDPHLDLYLLEGRSFPENANAFYAPILQWIAKFCEEAQSTQKNYVFHLKLNYYNSASSRQLFNLFKILEKRDVMHKVCCLLYVPIIYIKKC